MREKNYSSQSQETEFSSPGFLGSGNRGGKALPESSKVRLLLSKLGS